MTVAEVCMLIATCSCCVAPWGVLGALALFLSNPARGRT